MIALLLTIKLGVFNAEAGIMYQGKEKIKVSATGYAAQQQSTIGRFES